MAVPALSFDWERVRSALPESLQGRIQNARELLRRREEVHRETPLPTGLMPLDRLLRGGLERGALTEISGPRSSGRFAVALQALASATHGGEPAALIDLGGQLDPLAASALGCDMERLLWARANRLREALAAAETLLQTGFPLVVLDLGQPPVPGGRGQESAWTRLARAAEAQHAALLVSAPYRATGTAAATVLTARGTRAIWDGKGKEPRLLAGARSTVTLQKSRLQSDEQRSCELRWTIKGFLDPDSRDPHLLDSAGLHPPALPGERARDAARGASSQPHRSTEREITKEETISRQATSPFPPAQQGRAGGGQRSRGGADLAASAMGSKRRRTSLERALHERDRQ
jgi:hypothetical protein